MAKGGVIRRQVTAIKDTEADLLIIVGAGFEAAGLETYLSQRIGKLLAGRLADASAAELLRADVH